MSRANFLMRAGLVLALVTAACGPSQEELDAETARVRDLQGQLEEAQHQRQALEAQLAELRSHNDEMAQRLTALGQNVDELRGRAATLQTNLDETQRALDELRERERQAQARLATFRALLARFRAMIESGRLRVRIVRNRMVVELPAGVLFDSGRAELKPGGQQVLTEIAAVLRDIPDREFQIGGHTDNVPIRGSDNWTLSTQRAVTVTRFLVEQQVPGNRLSAAGYADTQPVASNDTEEGRAKNRRIEIALVPNLNELPDLTSLEGVSQ